MSATHQAHNCLQIVANLVVCLFKLLLSSLVVVLLPVVGVLALIINYLIPGTVNLLARRLHSSHDLGKMLSFTSSFFAADNLYKQPRANIVTICTVEGTLHLAHFRNLWRTNVMEATIPSDRANEGTTIKVVDEEAGQKLYPELTQCIYNWGGYTFWKEDLNFNLNEHINTLHLNYSKYSKPHDVDSELDIKDEDLLLSELREELLNRPWVRNKPLWEIFLIPGASGNKTFLVIRCHHCLADGYAILNLFISSLCKNSEFDNPMRTKRRERPGLMEMFTWALFLPFRGGYALAEHAVMALTYSIFRTKLIRSSSNSKQPLFLLKTIHPISVKVIKQIKTAYGVSFASVLHSLETAIVQELLRLKDEVDFPQSVSSVCVFPLKGHPLTLTNHLTACLHKLPTSLVCWRDRLIKCERDLRGLKESVVPFIYKLFLKLYGSYPKFLAQFYLSAQRFPILISNFPITSSTVFLDGHRILGCCAFTGIVFGGTGVGIESVSYEDTLTISVLVESSLFTSEQMDGIPEVVYRELDNLLVEATSAKDLGKDQDRLLDDL